MMTEDEKNKILEMDEVDSYFLIDECGAFIWRMTHEMAHGRIPEESHAAIQKDIDMIRITQKFAVDNLTRFDVDPESVNDKENGDYWKWYKFWDDWKKNLSDEEWDGIDNLMKNNRPINKYLPKGTWKN